MHIVKTRWLNRKQRRAAEAVTAEANAYDGTRYAVPDDADVYYLAYMPDGRTSRLAGFAAFYRMGDRRDGRTVYETAAAVSPKMRQRGIFSGLIAAADRKLAGSCVRYAVYENAAASAVLAARHSAYDHAELMLSCGLEGFDNRNDEVRIDHTEGRAYTQCGECWFRLDGSRKNAYIFGVLTYENCMRRGCAYTLLSSLFAELADMGISRAMLQVSSENLPALGLYDKLGMTETERLNLYYELF